MVETVQTQIPEVVDQAVENHDAKKSPQESFAELRKAKDDVERQLWQSQKEKELLEQHYKSQLQSQQQAKSIPQEEDFDYRQLEQEEYPEGKKIAQAFNKVERKFNEYEKKLAEKDQKLQILETQQSLPDFKDVVTVENIEKYIKSDEDNIEAMQKAENPLRKAYNLIKKDARYQADMASKKEKSGSQEQKRVEEKESKPRTASMGVRSEAISTAAGMSNSKMTKAQKQALWLETQALARK